jgi:hypothetical protein
MKWSEFRPARCGESNYLLYTIYLRPLSLTNRPVHGTIGHVQHTKERPMPQGNADALERIALHPFLFWFNPINDRL